MPRKYSLKIACATFMYSTPSFTIGADMSTVVAALDMGLSGWLWWGWVYIRRR